ncbi:MAG: peptide chain release factor 1 [Hyphomicrobiales bacterium]
MLENDKLKRMMSRFRDIEAKLSTSSDREEFIRLSKEYAEIEPIANAFEALCEANRERAALRDMATQTDDAAFAELARQEIETVDKRMNALADELKLLLLPKDKADNRNIILEIRAGTGGNEAALFAGDLFRMYQRYADLKGWTVEVLSASEAEIGGYREICAAVSGEDVFSRLKYESGVHRVQRVPATESQGRIHTSAATVAILPEPEEFDIEIADKDLRIDVFRSSGPGGQSVNTTDSAVRITHLPTGIVVSQQDEKSQHKNRARAMKVLRARLYERERERLDAERSAARRGQVGSGDRSERIRTYNFPQGRVSDHRINLTLYKLQQVLSGEALDEIIESLVTHYRAQILAAQGLSIISTGLRDDSPIAHGKGE